MGRTQRKRRHKTPRNFHACNESKEIVLLNSWLKKQGMKCNEKLVLAVFDETGRGVLTKRKIKAGEELLNLPLNCTINVTSILMDVDFCSIFLVNKTPCLVEYKRKVSFQSLMAMYLVFLKIQGPETKWSIYLKSLPKEYTVPYFLPNYVKCHIDSDILAVINKQEDIIKTSFHIFEEILDSSISEKDAVMELKANFTMSIYEWAYFTVNTRCVYMDLSKLVDLINIEDSILNLIHDNTKISLCPYLDMINHSPSARNETKLIVSVNVQNINVNYLDENLFSDVWFSIYTKSNFDAYNEVFICYGDSHNLKLITEYGFFLPANDLDYVSFNFEDILIFLKSKLIKLSQDQMAFIHNHSLNKDLYIDLRGLSFNLYGLLMVVKYFYNRSQDVSRMLYSAALCSNDKVLNELITPMVKDKLGSVKESISKLETYECDYVLSNCIALMSQYVVILEKFIKC